MNRRFSLTDLAAGIPDGASLALGGSFLHRGPFAMVRELVRQGRRDLEIIKQSPGYDIDLLCRAGAVKKARVGIVAMEGYFGLAPWYRHAVQAGEITLEEHACASLTAGLRAAAFGAPFQPCGGIFGSELAVINGWKEVEDPYGSGQSTFLIPKIQPDFAIIHVNEVSEEGDIRVFGTSHWDRLMTRAAKSVLVVAERCVPAKAFQERPELTLAPHFMVDGFAVVERGAWPGSCWPDYGIDYAEIERYMNSKDRDVSSFIDHVEGAGAES
ncbi:MULTISPECIES: CoA transferase subunit A [unclassified Sphingobium]|uniref:CoA transferase subunit A n=1 Tax=unclassified Sphingobium TaxID=2611147 RepID=UPI0022255A23|nr:MULTISPECIES: CoA-transferase [unclassified Sphingobium]MCW2411566.1 glutaconate CoA-transferase subunit A [Sphingobium sp. B8D3D]MCW2416141.1 glutaconate CoA-transferase subunit A [Sphingobium sp. B8D3A]